MTRLLFVFVFSVFALSCKTSAPTSNVASKTGRSVQSGLKGTWQITNVSYPGSDYFKVNSFQIADSKCFIGSTWSFIPNNNKGNLSLTNPDCQSFNSPIVWSIDKAGMFGFKIIDAGIKSKNVTQGYLLRVANQTDTSFQLIDVISVEGQKKDIIYQFEKVN